MTYIKNTSFSSSSLLEDKVRSYWDECNLSDKIIEENYIRFNKDPKYKFILYDGPPGTNGYPHLGHLLPLLLKDVFVRYNFMVGKYVFHKIGWDCHGLPVEIYVQKKYNLNNSSEIIKFGVSQFVKYCYDVSEYFKAYWRDTFLKFARLQVIKDEYSTNSRMYIEADWNILSQIWNKGLLYKGERILAYCPRLGTSLSNQEVAQGYKNIKDISVYVKFKLVSMKDTFFVVWTTTPWTLIGNTALVVNPELDYVKTKFDNCFYIISLVCLKKLVNKKILDESYLIDISNSFKGSEIVGQEYYPLWDFFIDDVKSFSVVGDSYVRDDSGSGIVHITPYGEDDYRIIKEHKLPIIQHVGADGKFTKRCGEYFNIMFDADGLEVTIIKDLKLKGLFLNKETIIHDYPFNYKTQTKLIYFLQSGWFIKTTEVINNIININKNINWIPSHITSGRFGKWLNNNVDWFISRDRYWGSPLPIWFCNKCDEFNFINSLKELKTYSNNMDIDESKVNLHLPYIDEFDLYCKKCSNRLVREKGVLDCWYNAGIMPWGQDNYINDKLANYPSDIICEGQDQTRGWFYALLVISYIINGDSSYKSVICSGLVLDDKGLKMSKSLGNIISPNDIFEKYGVDILRWSFFSTNYLNNIKVSDKLFINSQRKFINSLWNCYTFFITYADIDKYVCLDVSSPSNLTNTLDIWIVSLINSLIKSVRNSLDKYDTLSASKSIYNFINSLSNWYIRRNRKRFWRDELDSDKINAYNTLHYVIFQLIHIIAPITPYISEYIYIGLYSVNKNLKNKFKNSIHLNPYPKYNVVSVNSELESSVLLVREIVSYGHILRNRLKIRVRQPLKNLTLIIDNNNILDTLNKFELLIKDELNVKDIVYNYINEDECNYTVKINFRYLGKVYPSFMKKISRFLIKANHNDIVNKLKKYSYFELKIDDRILKLTNDAFIISKNLNLKEDYEIYNNIIIYYNTVIDFKLEVEGLVRDIINKIQSIRKENGMDILDNINLQYFLKNEMYLNEILNYHNYISKECLINSIKVYKTFEQANKDTNSIVYNSCSTDIILNISKVD